MAGLGPFEPAPHLAVAVSGGADSMALVHLAAQWAAACGGSVLGLIVDHRLRPDSSAEAVLTARRLRSRGIDTEIFSLDTLRRGPGLAARARAARHSALAEACLARGILHLLLGHHAADQAETVLIRALSASGPDGLAAMPALTVRAGVRWLRPLLAIPPARLRATLNDAGIAWIDDPSNTDQTALRPRLRHLRFDQAGCGPATTALVAAAAAAGEQRAARGQRTAAILAERARFYPEGFAAVTEGPIHPAALSPLIQAVTGAVYPPPPRQVASLAADLRPATLAGAQLIRSRSDFLLLREAAAMQPPVPAMPGAVWDQRFRLLAEATPPLGATLGPLGRDSARLRNLSLLPAVILSALPALRCGETLFAVPHLGYPDRSRCARVPVVFAPSRPAASAAFTAA